jgi:hypothetical protein
MCLIHDETLHYIYQNLMEAFMQSEIPGPVLLRHVGAQLCTCIEGTKFCFVFVFIK